jgi:heterodisulfide reductase subunit B
LGIELPEVEDWNCCGATTAATVDPLLALALPARDLAAAERQGLTMMTPCPACYKNMRKTNAALAKDETLRQKVNDTLGDRRLEGSPEVRHPLDIIVNDVGLDAIPVEKPLEGLKVACYYGCLITRPKGGFDSPENPQSMDRLVLTLGAEAVAFPYKTKCCGGAVFLPKPELAMELTGKVLVKAKAAGANCVAVGCPFCHLLLDMYQGKVEAHIGSSLGLPILYFSQLMGLAMAVEEAELGLERLAVSPEPLLREQWTKGMAA